jgi:hypothetical protein
MRWPIQIDNATGPARKIHRARANGARYIAREDGGADPGPGTDLLSHRLLLGHDDPVISGRPARWTDKQLEWAARKAAGDALKPDDELLDIAVGNLKRLRDNGIERAVAPKRWANAIPPTRGLMIITYTRQRTLFVSTNGPRVHCPLVRIHRAALLENRNQLFAFTMANDALTVMEFEQASRRASTRPGRFVDRLVTIRDEERAKLPAERLEHIERIDLVVQTYSLGELWSRPPGPVRGEPDDDSAALSGPEQGNGAGARIDEDVWERLARIIRAAHERDREVFAALGRSFAAEMELRGHQRTELYLWYLLRYALGGKVGGRMPTDAELARISHDYAARFSAVVDADRPLLEDTFRKVFDRPPLTKQIGPGEVFVLGSAALGALYEDPDAELSRMKPHLASWWQKHAERFHREGLLR